MRLLQRTMHFLVLLASLAGLSAAAEAQHSISATDLPALHRAKGVNGRVRHGFQSGSISLVADSGTVSLRWKASARENLEPDWTLRWNGADQVGNDRYREITQELKANFFVTTACIVSGREIVVGGVDRQGRSVLERWALSWPDPMPAVKYDVATGVSSVEPVLVGRSSVERFYSAANPRMHLPRSTAALRRQSDEVGAVLVQFDDSGDVHVVPFDGSAPTLIASSSNASAVLGRVPGLVGAFQVHMSFADHVEKGYLYHVSRSVAGRQPPTPYPSFPYHVVFEDSNRDGTLDRVSQVTQDDWFTQGWHDAGKHVEPWRF